VPLSLLCIASLGLMAIDALLILRVRETVTALHKQLSELHYQWLRTRDLNDEVVEAIENLLALNGRRTAA
jgi:hypothetical protein